MVSHVYKLTTFNESQYWLRWFALQAAIWFLAKSPLIFLPVTRGSLLTSVLGVTYAQAIKFHRRGTAEPQPPTPAPRTP